mmetsp:Transcript_12997/g.40066  ORF Transcript_12997/g.40066 Transcript_12997/m.40066 type:complete len:120 (+) Transcript_12997:313-672(+)
MSLKAMDHLEVIKLLCKDFWYGIFRKQIDKLQTNHRGVFVLKDYSFRWMHQCSCGTDVVLNKVNVHVLQFPCGLLRGALSSLGSPRVQKISGFVISAMRYRTVCTCDCRPTISAIHLFL